MNYTAPEIVVTRKCSALSDILSFGCVFFFETLTSRPIQKVKPLASFGAPINFSRDAAERYRPMLVQCLQVSSQIRPTARVLASEYFQTMPLRALTYLDLLITKEPKEKFGFFKGLSQALHGFSPLMIKAKILPILVQECRAEIRFTPVLLGTIFDSAGKFSVSEFTDEVFNKIAFLTTVSDPPEVVIAFLQSIRHCTTIVFNALQATSFKCLLTRYFQKVMKY
jgi:serine/threonine protein kinase